MVNEETLNKLFNAFPHGFINRNLEFVTNEKTNTYIVLRKTELDTDIACALLEYVSRDACKTQWFAAEKNNEMWQDYNRNGINKFCGAEFSREDMTVIYEAVGNGIHPALTKEFIEKRYDVEWLKKTLDEIRYNKKDNKRETQRSER